MLALLAAGWARAGEVEFRRGEFGFSVAPVPAFVEPREIPAQWDPAAPGAADGRWRYWLYDMQVDRRMDRSERHVDFVYEPISPSMLGDAGRVQVGFNPGYQQLRIHRVEVRRDGAWLDRLQPDKISLARRESDFERNLADGEVSALIVLEDVRVNDLVRVSYTVSGSNPILAGQMSDWSHMGWGSPVLDVHLRVLGDPGTDFAIHRENGAPAAKIIRTADATQAAFHVHGAAPVLDDGGYPAWYQPYPLVQVARAQGWADVVAWATPLYPTVDTLPAELDARLVEWSRLDDPFDRIRAALRTVQDEIRYFGAEMGENTHRPHPPAETWDRRYGDCKDKVYLLVTILERLGVEAAPALVSTERGRALLEFVPSASAFNHVIVRARVGDTVMWLDPTISGQGGDPRDSDMAAYGVALPVVAGVKALERITPARAFDSGVSVTEHYSVTDDGSVVFEVGTVYRGPLADEARGRLVDARVNEISQRFANYYQRRLGELSILEPVAVEDDRKGNIVTVTERYRLESPFDSEGPQQQALDVFGQALDVAMQLPNGLGRVAPVSFSRPARFEHRIRLDAPAGWSPTFRSDSVAHASATFDYRRDIRVDGQRVEVDYVLDTHVEDVAGEQLAAHLRDLARARDSLSARLRFRVPGSSGAEERSARLKALLRDVMTNGDSK